LCDIGEQHDQNRGAADRQPADNEDEALRATVNGFTRDAWLKTHYDRYAATFAAPFSTMRTMSAIIVFSSKFFGV
jgi:hypothetical protein